METVLFEDVFDQILLKRLKSTVSDKLFQLCISPSPTFLKQLDMFNFPPICCLSNLD